MKTRLKTTMFGMAGLLLFIAPPVQAAESVAISTRASRTRSSSGPTPKN